MAYGKRYKTAASHVEPMKAYTLSDAVNLVKANATAKFDETIDVTINLNIDTRKADQQMRGVVQLPNGLGKTIRALVFCKPERVAEAIKAGADIAGSDELIEEVLKGRSDFDRVIATPDMMVAVGKLGKALGPRGLMPNPKLGTVAADLEKAITAVKGGQLEYRAEKNGIVQAGVGKASFAEKSLYENVKFFIDTVAKARPTGAKGVFVKRISLSSTMGPGVRVDVGTLGA